MCSVCACESTGTRDPELSCGFSFITSDRTLVSEHVHSDHFMVFSTFVYWKWTSPRGHPGLRTVPRRLRPALLPHPIQARLRSIPALPPLTSALKRRRQHVLNLTGQAKSSACPPPAPFPASRTEDWLRHWDATGERFFLQPRLRGRGHTAAFWNLGWRVTRRNLGARKRRRPRALGPPPPLPPTPPPFPMHSGKCSPLHEASGREHAVPNHEFQDSMRPEWAT